VNSEQTLRELTNAIVKGDILATGHAARRLMEKEHPVTATLDAIVDASNIVNDLYNIGEYDRSNVTASSRATLAALQVLDPQLSIEESKGIGKVVVGCIPEDALEFDMPVASSVLRAAGFKTINLPRAVTYENLTSIASQNQCDLVVLLIKTREDDPRVQRLALELRESLLKKTLKVIVGGNLEAARIYGKYGFTNYFSDLGDLVSKLTEIVIKEQEAR